MTWQPIESAPRDGTALLVFSDSRAFEAHWVDEPRNSNGGFWFSIPAWKSVSPTHWTPLPQPPKE